MTVKRSVTHISSTGVVCRKSDLAQVSVTLTGLYDSKKVSNSH